MPPAAKCFSRSRFLPSDPTSQDVHWPPLMLTLAYAQVLQYWVEKVRPPMLGGYCPLAMSIVELRQQVEGYFTFSKQDIFHNLGGTVPEARSKDTEAPQEGAIAPPTTIPIGSVEPCTTKSHGADDTILASLGCTPNDEFPPAKPTPSLAEINLPQSAEISPRGSTKMSLAKINTDTPKDLVTIRAASPAKAESQVVPTSRLVDKLASPPTPSDQVGGEKQCILSVTTSVGKLNLEATGVTSIDTMFASVRGVAFRNPHMAATGMLQKVSWPKGIWQKTRSRCATTPRPPLRKKLITAFGQEDYHAIWWEHIYSPLWQ